MGNKRYAVKGGKKLRYGYTTGSCAAAASVAAAEMLITEKILENVRIVLPDGESAIFDIEDKELHNSWVRCSVLKDSGDDPDVTSGMKIFAKVSITNGVKTTIDGGEGIGRITANGLQCKVGEYAINPVPRRMIIDNLNKVAADHSFTHGFAVEISAPRGETIALKTFNPRLGIKGGISILGTTGLVEPMSEKALIDTIKISVDKR